MAGTIQKAANKVAEQQRQNREGTRTLRDSVKAAESQFALALPKHVDSGRFLRAALTALNTVPKLAECTEQSVLAGLMQAAQLGLEVADVRGQAYLIPRWDAKAGQNKATFQLGYRGMIDLAARAGITVDCDTIYEHDTYDYQRGTDARLYHKPTLGDPGEPVAYYAVAHFADGRKPAFLLMSVAQVMKHRDQFASAKNRQGDIYGPWVEHFDAMALKTVIRRLLDKLPTSVELRQAVVQESEQESQQPTVASYASPLAPQLGAADDIAADGGYIDTQAYDVPEGVDAETGELRLDAE